MLTHWSYVFLALTHRNNDGEEEEGKMRMRRMGRISRLNKWRVMIWTNVGLVYCHIYASFGLNDFLYGILKLARALFDETYIHFKITVTIRRKNSLFDAAAWYTGPICLQMTFISPQACMMISPPPGPVIRKAFPWNNFPGDDTYAHFNLIFDSQASLLTSS